MSLRVPLAAFVVAGALRRDITRELRDLSFRSSIPGGFATCTLSLDRALASQMDLVPFTKVIIYDTRSAEVVWQGYIDDPGKGASDQGVTWQISATGPSTRAEDQTRAYAWCLDGDENWNGTEASVPGTTVGGGGALGFKLQFNNGTPVYVGNYVSINNDALAFLEYYMARCTYTCTSNTDDMDFYTRFKAYNSDTTGDTWQQSSGTSGRRGATVTTDFLSSDVTAEIQFVRDNVDGTVGDDNAWVEIRDIRLISQRYDVNGSRITAGGSYTHDGVYAHEVVADLLGNGSLPTYDGPLATIATGSTLIHPLAYVQGATPRQVLDDLTAIEAADYWAVWEDTPSGKSRFEWRAWPTSPQYEIDVVDGWDNPGSASSLYNAVDVIYKKPWGTPGRYTASGSVSLLTAAGITRRGLVDLGGEAGSEDTAPAAATRFLAEHATPASQGTLTVARPVLDLLRGRMVPPWAIRPGVLVRVRGVDVPITALNANARDGIATFRVVETTFDASTGAATLSLDTPPYSVAQALVEQATTTKRHRRR